MEALLKLKKKKQQNVVSLPTSILLCSHFFLSLSLSFLNTDERDEEEK